MNLVFCGTPDFAVPTLERLIAEKFKIDLVITNVDEPSGRGYEVKAPPVKRSAVSTGLEVYQPARLKDPSTVEFLSQFRPDAMVVVAYGHILPKWMIDLPRWGCINLHASLLPKYRGAAPIQWSIVRGETVTGVTTIRIDEGLDTGDILLRREVAIQQDDTAETLSEHLSRIGAELMVETLRRLDGGNLVAQPQDHAQATLAPILKKDDGRINWNLPARDIRNRVRGLRPWPGAYTRIRGKNLHLWSADLPSETVGALDPGTIVAEHRRLRIACAQGTLLEPKEIQLEGRKRMPAGDFLNGMRITPGEKVE